MYTPTDAVINKRYHKKQKKILREEITKLKEKAKIFLGEDVNQDDQKNNTEPNIETFLEEKEIVELIIDLLEHKKCPLGIFTKKLLKEKLRNYVRHPKHQEWSPEVIKFCILVKFYGRKKLSKFMSEFSMMIQ